MKEKFHEECAVFGVNVASDIAAGITYNGLLALQHRGQEGAGIAVLADGAIKLHKDMGLVSEVFQNDGINKLPKSHMAVGHNRYSTTGNNIPENAQPFLTEYLTGRIATVHNGNITNAEILKTKLKERGLDFVASSDSEVISSLIAYHIMQNRDAITGVIKAGSEIEGAYSLIVLSSENKLIALRDPKGFRPLCIGKNEDGIVISSESCAIDNCGFEFVRDVKPGEIVVVEDGEIVYSNVVLTSEKQGLCIFEYVYFARPDSVIDKLSVYEARCNMGKMLAREKPVEADIVCGVPDSGLEAAMGYAIESGLPYTSAFAKNRYIGRSFIFPTQAQRANAVHMKLNPLKATVDGKRIVLIDDSIVRGTTCANIVKALKDAGAKEVHMRISSPPFKHTCYYGTDIGSEDNLIANKYELEEIRKQIGADSLAYISVKGLKTACQKSSMPFCTRCFSGYDKEDLRNISKDALEK